MINSRLLYFVLNRDNSCSLLSYFQWGIFFINVCWNFNQLLAVFLSTYSDELSCFIMLIPIFVVSYLHSSFFLYFLWGHLVLLVCIVYISNESLFSPKRRKKTQVFPFTYLITWRIITSPFYLNNRIIQCSKQHATKHLTKTNFQYEKFLYFILFSPAIFSWLTHAEILIKAISCVCLQFSPKQNIKPTTHLDCIIHNYKNQIFICFSVLEGLVYHDVWSDRN